MPDFLKKSGILHSAYKIKALPMTNDQWHMTIEKNTEIS